MMKAFDKFGTEIGDFNGRFVLDNNGVELYWIDGEDVFSTPYNDNGSHLARLPYIAIGEFNGKSAMDEGGEIIFVINSKLANANNQP